MYDKDNQYVMKTLAELLPMSFGPQGLLPPPSQDHVMGTETKTGTETEKGMGR